MRATRRRERRGTWVVLHLLLAVGLGCASSGPPPTVDLDRAGNITVSNVPDGIECVWARIEGEGMNPLDVPRGVESGLSTGVQVRNGRVTFPVGATMISSVRITTIVVHLAPPCAEVTQTWEYTGDGFRLSPGDRRTIPWDSFAER